VRKIAKDKFVYICPFYSVMYIVIYIKASTSGYCCFILFNYHTKQNEMNVVLFFVVVAEIFLILEVGGTPSHCHHHGRPPSPSPSPLVSSIFPSFLSGPNFFAGAARCTLQLGEIKRRASKQQLLGQRHCLIDWLLARALQLIATC
jgi:hypothetical protein